MSYHSSAKHRRHPSSWMQKSGIIGAIGRSWQRSYAPDYLGFALLVAAYMMVTQLTGGYGGYADVSYR